MDLDQAPLLDDADPFVADRGGEPQQRSSQPSEGEEDSEQARALQARQRAPRGRRPLSVDDDTQVPNAVFRGWIDDYLANMARAREQRAYHRAAARAKRNAYFFVYGRGLGGSDAANPAFALPNHPLAAFCGARLEHLVATAGGGRGAPKRSSSPATDDTDRRTRPRTDDGPEHAREPDPFAGADDDAFAPLLEDNTLEAGRAPASSLADDRSSAMPWNLASSRGGSLQQQQQYAGSRVSSHAFASAPHQPLTAHRGSVTAAAPFDRRASRIGLSPTPLRGHGGASRAPSSIDLPSPGAMLPSSPGGDEGMLGPPPSSTPIGTAKAAGPATPWSRAALGREAGNFLAFVRARAGPMDGDDEEQGEEGMVGVRFSELLPADEHPRVVAAQAFQHVLVLATRGAVRARQAEGAWGDVWIGVRPEGIEPAGAAAAA